MNLASLQHNMRKWLETGAPDGAEPFGDKAQRGLSVYLNNYRTQLLDCLEAAFPCTLIWLGQAEFRSAARWHIMHHPPTGWTLADYPATFAALLSARFPDDRVAPELAQLELALGDALIAADRPPVTRAMLTALDWAQVALGHAAGGQVLHHHSNAAAIWSALSRSATAPDPEFADAGSQILVWRSEWVACFRVLNPDEAEIFAGMDHARPFTAICGLLEQRCGNGQTAGERAGQLLARWVDDEAVSIAVSTLAPADT